jgi:hypothetical protein
MSAVDVIAPLRERLPAKLYAVRKNSRDGKVVLDKPDAVLGQIREPASWSG